MPLNETVSTDVDTMHFEDFNLNNAILKGIKEAGFTKPSPIQEKVIPIILSGKDVIGQAATGTGKTAAYGLPVINGIQNQGGAQVLIITPTRELANQVSDEIYKLGKYDGIRTVSVYGGKSYSRQLKQLKDGAQVVVATPGRLLDLLNSKRLGNFDPKVVILDEADEMLDLGFIDDIKAIFKYLPEDRQTLLFSATMPLTIKKLAKEILNDPERITIAEKKENELKIDQQFYVIEDHERDDAIIRLMDVNEPEKSIVFCRTKRDVDRLCRILIDKGLRSDALHGDMEQRHRENVLRGFRHGDFDILVATDVAARGLDVSDVSHVYNYHMASDSKNYIHRIGRTGRAGKSGMALTLVTPGEMRGLRRIQSEVNQTISHETVPDKTEAIKRQAGRLLDSLKDQQINQSSFEVSTYLMQELGGEDLLLKVISYILEKEQTSGPDQIGLQGKRLSRILSNAEHSGNRKMRKRRNSRGKGRYQKKDTNFSSTKAGPRRKKKKKQHLK